MKKSQSDEDEDYMFLCRLHITYNTQTESKKSLCSYKSGQTCRIKCSHYFVYTDKCWFAVLCRFWLQCGRTLRSRGQPDVITAVTIRQCLSIARPRAGTGPWHQLYRVARGSPGICHFSFLNSFHE